MKIIFSIAVALLIPLAAFAADPATRPAAAPKVGDTAPEFSLDTVDGKTIKLSDLTKTGPVVIVQLRGWNGYQCPYCTKQVADLVGHAKAISGANAQVILVYPGTADDLTKHAKDFVAGKDLPDGFTLVTDPGLKFVESYGLRWDAPKETAYPATFVVDDKGVVKFAQISHSHGNRVTADQVVKALGKLTK